MPGEYSPEDCGPWNEVFSSPLLGSCSELLPAGLPPHLKQENDALFLRVDVRTRDSRGTKSSPWPAWRVSGPGRCRAAGGQLRVAPGSAPSDLLLTWWADSRVCPLSLSSDHDRKDDDITVAV